jgi:hypothetical protein|tara:strand:+ start:61 stop:189 length:129 start_codon:yes stop_codon:yes gene_type:complete
MTEDDIKYRQGRSKERVEATYKMAYFAYLGIIISLVIAALTQ